MQKTKKKKKKKRIGNEIAKKRVQLSDYFVRCKNANK